MNAQKARTNSLFKVTVFHSVCSKVEKIVQTSSM